MSLSCSCLEGDWEPGAVYWYEPKDFSVYAKRRATRCKSCGARIARGDTVGAWNRVKVPESIVECRIYGEDGEVPMAPDYHCETCAGLAFSLSDLGYCSQPYEDQRALVREHADMHRRPAPEIVEAVRKAVETRPRWLRNATTSYERQNLASSLLTKGLAPKGASFGEIVAAIEIAWPGGLTPKTGWVPPGPPKPLHWNSFPFEFFPAISRRREKQAEALWNKARIYLWDQREMDERIEGLDLSLKREAQFMTAIVLSWAVLCLIAAAAIGALIGYAP